MITCARCLACYLDGATTLPTRKINKVAMRLSSHHIFVYKIGQAKRVIQKSEIAYLLLITFHQDGGPVGTGDTGHFSLSKAILPGNGT